MNKIVNLPNKIYLQIDADGETPINFKELGAVTWCSDLIHKNDIQYVIKMPESDPTDRELMLKELSSLILQHHDTGASSPNLEARKILEWVDNNFVPIMAFHDGAEDFARSKRGDMHIDLIDTDLMEQYANHISAPLLDKIEFLKKEIATLIEMVGGNNEQTQSPVLPV